jgi:hypothetical protein
MTSEVKFYTHPGNEREDWYRLVVSDDGATNFVEHTWSYHNTDGAMEMNSGRLCIPVSEFLSKEYPEEAKAHLRKLLSTMSLGESNA